MTNRTKYLLAKARKQGYLTLREAAELKGVTVRTVTKKEFITMRTGCRVVFTPKFEQWQPKIRDCKPLQKSNL